jgi:hypothetical protein
MGHRMQGVASTYCRPPVRGSRGIRPRRGPSGGEATGNTGTRCCYGCRGCCCCGWPRASCSCCCSRSRRAKPGSLLPCSPLRPKAATSALSALSVFVPHRRQGSVRGERPARTGPRPGRRTSLPQVPPDQTPGQGTKPLAGPGRLPHLGARCCTKALARTSIFKSPVPPEQNPAAPRGPVFSPPPQPSSATPRAAAPARPAGPRGARTGQSSGASDPGRSGCRS